MNQTLIKPESNLNQTQIKHRSNTNESNVNQTGIKQESNMNQTWTKHVSYINQAELNKHQTWKKTLFFWKHQVNIQQQESLIPCTLLERRVMMINNVFVIYFPNNFYSNKNDMKILKYSRWSDMTRHEHWPTLGNPFQLPNSIGVRDHLDRVHNVILIECIFGFGKPRGGRDFG